MRSFGCLCITTILSLFALVSSAQTADTGVLKLPTEIVFKGPPGLAPQSAILFGDPSKPGVYVIRVKLPPGYKSNPHFHGEEFRGVTVLSGTLYFAVSEVWDESKLRAYPAGTFFTEPAKLPHYATTKETEVIFDLTGIGPTSTTPMSSAK